MTTIGATNLSNSSGGSANAYSTASISPSPNTLVIVTVFNANTSGNAGTPTVSGASGTWQQILSYGAIGGGTGRRRYTLFRDLSPSPGSGALTIDFAGVSQTGCGWSIDQFANTDTSGAHGAGAIVQSNSANSTTSSTGITVTLSALGDANNVAYGSCNLNLSESLTKGANFTDLVPGTTNLFGTTYWDVEYAANQTGVNWTWTSSTVNAVATAIEIKAGIIRAAVATLTDNFNDNSFNTALWVDNSALSGTLAETGGQLKLTPANSTVNSLAQCTSVTIYALAGSAVFAQIVSIADATNCNTVLSFDHDMSNGVGIRYNSASGNLEAYKYVATVDSVVGSGVAYNATTMQWWKLSETSGTLTYSYSADSTSWTTLTSTATPIDLTSGLLSLWVLERVSDATPGVGIYDNVNISVTAKTVDGMGRSAIRVGITKDTAGLTAISAGAQSAVVTGMGRFFARAAHLIENAGRFLTSRAQAAGGRLRLSQAKAFVGRFATQLTGGPPLSIMGRFSAYSPITLTHTGRIAITKATALRGRFSASRPVSLAGRLRTTQATPFTARFLSSLPAAQRGRLNITRTATALSLYGYQAHATTLSTANIFYTTSTGQYAGVTQPIHTTDAGYYGEIYSQGTVTDQFTAASIGDPTGHGWMWDVTTLGGNTLVSGTYTAKMVVKSATASHVTYTWRVYRWSPGNVYSFIGSGTSAQITIPNSNTPFTFTFSGVDMAFTSSDRLYVDVWGYVNVAPASNTDLYNEYAYSGSSGYPTTMALLTPGYYATSARTLDSAGRTRLTKGSTTPGRFALLASRMRDFSGSVGIRTDIPITLATPGIISVTVGSVLRGRVSISTPLCAAGFFSVQIPVLQESAGLFLTSLPQDLPGTFLLSQAQDSAGFFSMISAVETTLDMAATFLVSAALQLDTGGQFLLSEVFDSAGLFSASQSLFLKSILRIAGARYQTLILGSGPIAFWQLNEPANTIYYDLTGNGHDSVSSIAMSTRSPGPLRYFGPDVVASFDGSASSLHFPVDTTGWTALTLEAWAYLDDNSTGATIITNTEIYGTLAGFHLAVYYDPDIAQDRFSFILRNDSGASIVYTLPTGSTFVGSWHYVTATYTGTTLSLYLDGHSLGAGVEYIDGFAGSQNDVFVGASYKSPIVDFYWDGALSNVAIYNYALTPEEVMQHYSVGFDPDGVGRFASSLAHTTAGRFHMLPTDEHIYTVNGLFFLSQSRSCAGRILVNTTVTYDAAGYVGIQVPQTYDTGGRMALGIETELDSAGYVAIAIGAQQTTIGRFLSAALQSLTTTGRLILSVGNNLTGRFSTSLASVLQGRFLASQARSNAGRTAITQSIHQAGRVATSLATSFAGRVSLGISSGVTLPGRLRLSLAQMETGKFAVSLAHSVPGRFILLVTNSITTDVTGRFKLLVQRTQDTIGRLKVCIAMSGTLAGRIAVAIAAQDTFIGQLQVSLASLVAGRMMTSLASAISGRLSVALERLRDGTGRFILVVITHATETLPGRVAIAIGNIASHRARLKISCALALSSRLGVSTAKDGMGLFLAFSGPRHRYYMGRFALQARYTRDGAGRFYLAVGILPSSSVWRSRTGTSGWIGTAGEITLKGTTGDVNMETGNIEP